jgi:hemerythrin-like metal-binding protein
MREVRGVNLVVQAYTVAESGVERSDYGAVLSECQVEYQWEERFSTGDESIDLQHKAVFDLSNAFFRAHGRDQLDNSLGRLIDYVRQHFAYEEALMQQMYMVDHQEHILSHRYLTDRLETLQGRLSDDSLDRMELSLFLNHWTSAHIPRLDANLVECLRLCETRRGDLFSS